MYCCFSSKSSNKIKTIRVVHLNGYVEDFDHPISVDEVIGKTQKHFMFTQSQLLSTCLKPLNPDYMLQKGQIYFLLPHSTFQSSCVSPIDLAPIARRLSNIAKNPMAKAKSKKKKSSSGTSPVWNSPASSPNRFSGQGAWVESKNGLIAYGIGENISTKSPTWTPVLDTIREMSFNRISESDMDRIFLDNRNEAEVQEKNYVVESVK